MTTHDYVRKGKDLLGRYYNNGTVLTFTDRVGSYSISFLFFSKLREP